MCGEPGPASCFRPYLVPVRDADIVFGCRATRRVNPRARRVEQMESAMKRRSWKFLVLAASGCVLFQAAGCAQAIIQSLATNILPLIISQLVLGSLQGSTT